MTEEDKKPQWGTVTINGVVIGRIIDFTVTQDRKLIPIVELEPIALELVKSTERVD